MASFTALLALGSAAFTAVGTAARGSQEAAAMDANAKALRVKGMQERAAGSVRAERRYREAQRLVSMQQAELAHSGGGVGGSGAEIMGETARKGLVSSNLEAWQGEQRGRGYEDEAAIQKWAARQRRRALPIEVGAALLTGASRVASGGGFGGAPSGGSTGGSSSGLYYG